MKKVFFAAIFCVSILPAFAQSGYWQQRVEYVMDIDMDVATNRYTGKQKLTYYNNSPDTIYKVFYHLYFNAFKPGSEMDWRNKQMPDPDKRLNKISNLKPAEQGYQKVNSLKQDGKTLTYNIEGTILEVTLDKPIAPGKKAVFEMDMEAQVPLQIRRGGRDNAENIRYSMSQWYPKMCAYDAHGWHPNEYIGREFYGEWGDFEVNISIDSSYTIGGTGYLQNATEVGHGYEDGQKVKRPAGNKLTWKFKAQNIHDFVWAADPDYVVSQQICKNGVKFYFVYQPDSATNAVWPKFGPYMERALDWINEHYGQYPYKQYSFIQGGDGGMEYPMATLITGKRGFSSLVGVSVHEMLHSWFQGVLAFDESHYSWMDEGFTTYVSDEVMDMLGYGDGNPLFWDGYSGYLSLVEDNENEPLTTHADYFNSNRSYGVSAYNSGGVFLHQLRYLVGETNYRNGMLRFFNEWKMKHPDALSLKRVMEKTSGLELDWYFEQFINSTNTIDYAVKTYYFTGDKSIVKLERKGRMMMPLEIQIVYANNTRETVYIPIPQLRGVKTDFTNPAKTLNDWEWSNPTYTFELSGKGKVKQIIIDPGYYIADTDRDNNILNIPDGAEIVVDGE